MHLSESTKKILTLGHLASNISRAKGKVGMGPGMGSDLVSSQKCTLDGRSDSGVVDIVVILPIDKEGDLDLSGVQVVEQRVCFCARTVVKGNRKGAGNRAGADHGCAGAFVQYLEFGG